MRDSPQHKLRHVSSFHIVAYHPPECYLIGLEHTRLYHVQR